ESNNKKDKSQTKKGDIEKTYIIGDSLTSDMQGGANSGIKTIWFNKARRKNIYDFCPTYEVNSVAQLDALIEKLEKQ
ncbi:MAG: HAD hydrolase-like protein, partial [Clostridia bacterium]